MAPFKPFLSPRCKFSWSPELESTFQASKEAIIEAIRQGVEIFDIQRRTCLRPDWSKRGIGYFLLQQHCSCPSSVPDCCPGGWRITLAGSRFSLRQPRDSHRSQTPYLPICKSLYAEEGVLLYQDRVVVPPSLRRRVLQNLHAAHQGTSSMEQRDRAIVYWPGISKDIRETREGCADCNRNAPSQAATPPLPSTPPLSPFEAVFANFFDYRGCHYLVVVDRLSGWVEVLSSTAGPSSPSPFLLRYVRRPGGDLKRRWPRVHR